MPNAWLLGIGLMLYSVRLQPCRGLCLWEHPRECRSGVPGPQRKRQATSHCPWPFCWYTKCHIEKACFFLINFCQLCTWICPPQIWRSLYIQICHFSLKPCQLSDQIMSTHLRWLQGLVFHKPLLYFSGFQPEIADLRGLGMRWWARKHSLHVDQWGNGLQGLTSGLFLEEQDIVQHGVRCVDAFSAVDGAILPGA